MFSWIRKISAIVSSILIIVLFNYCTSYSKLVLPENEPISIDDKTIIIHYHGKEYYLTKPQIKKDHFVGVPVFISQPLSSAKSDYLHIYFDQQSVNEVVSHKELKLPFTSITRVETYEFDTGTTVLKVFGGILIVLLLLVIIVAATKKSCPFIYIYNGEQFNFVGEIYSGAIHPPLERHDYLPLPDLVPVDQEYRIKMANRVREIQYTNLAELFIVDHPKGTELLIDKYGQPHTLSDVYQPVQGTNLEQEDITKAISKIDNIPYLRDIEQKNGPLMDGMILQFNKPSVAGKGKLVIKAKNSFWLDFMFGQFYRLFGDGYEYWMDRQKNAPIEELKKWGLDQGIPLSVFIENNGTWQYVDNFEVIGPMAYKKDIMEIELPVSNSDVAKVKLEFGSLFWEIDYVGMDFSADMDFDIHKVSMNSAVNEKNVDVADLMLKDDDKYYSMEDIGEEAVMRFSALKKTNESERSFYLHSKGYYEFIMEPEGTPNIGYLKTFEQPGRFIEFSIEKYIELKQRLEN